MILYLRKVVESYRVGFVSPKELKTDLHMDFKRVRQLNRWSATQWYFKHRIVPYLKPKKRKPMKPETNKVKDLEAKIKWLEKENEMLRMKSIAWETLVDIAKNNLIFLSKKVRTQAVEALSSRYPLLGMSLMCSWFGFSPQAWYAAIKQMEKNLFEFDLVIV